MDFRRAQLDKISESIRGKMDLKTKKWKQYLWKRMNFEPTKELSIGFQPGDFIDIFEP